MPATVDLNQEKFKEATVDKEINCKHTSSPPDDHLSNGNTPVPTITTTEDTKQGLSCDIHTATTANGEQVQQPAQKLWQPLESRMINGRFVKTYEEWLNEKKQAKKEEQQQQETITDLTKSSGNLLPKTLDQESEERRKAFKEWHTNKEKVLRKQKMLGGNNLLSPQPLRRTRTMSSNGGGGGFSFEEWLEKKRSQPPRSLTPNPPQSESSTKNSSKRERLRHGMTFEEWKAWKSQDRKRKLREIAENYESSFMDLMEKERRQALNASNYEQWLRQKNQERRLSIALEETVKAQRDEEKLRQRVERYYDPHLKTFDEWLLEKKYSQRFNNNNNNNDTVMSDGFGEDDGYDEAGTIIYDMWLKNKFSQEIHKEMEKLEALKSNVGNGGGRFSRSMAEEDEYTDEDESENKSNIVSRNNSLANKIENNSSTEDDSDDEDASEDKSNIEIRNNSLADKIEKDSSTHDNSGDKDVSEEKIEKDLSTDDNSDDEDASENKSKNGKSK